MDCQLAMDNNIYIYKIVARTNNVRDLDVLEYFT